MDNQAIKKLESDLWESADLLRAGSKLTSQQYCMPVLGLLFLRYAYSRFKKVEEEILKSRPVRNGRVLPVEASDFAEKSALFLPQQAQYSWLVNLPENIQAAGLTTESGQPMNSLGEVVNHASKILTLGNLAIITQSLNASIRDASWSTKKSGKGAKPGLNICASGLLTLFDALSLDKWDEQSITARAEWLYQKAEEIWNMGDLPETNNPQPSSNSDDPGENETGLSETEILEKSLTRISAFVNQDLISIRGRSYKTSDSKKGFVLAYSNGRLESLRWKYWYRYQTEMMVNIAECEEKYLVLICVTNDEIYILPMDYLEQAKASMNFTSDENDQPKYWHVVLYKNEAGKMIHLLSRPTLKEVDIDRYRL